MLLCGIRIHHSLLENISNLIFLIKNNQKTGCNISNNAHLQHRQLVGPSDGRITRTVTYGSRAYLSAHDGHLSCRPDVVNVAPQMLRTHHAIRPSVRLKNDLGVRSRIVTLRANGALRKKYSIINEILLEAAS